MKRILIIISIFCLSIYNVARAQNMTQEAVYLVSNPQTARWSYIETDDSGKKIATVYNSVESIEGDGINGKIKLCVDEVTVASPKDTIRSFISYRFEDGECMVDMYAGFEDNILEGKRIDSLVLNTIEKKQPDLSEERKKEVFEKTKSQLIKISGETRGIPRYPKVGQLPDYEFHIKFSMLSMTIIGKDRRIVGTERIQTETGSYDCFIMEETISTKAMMLKEVTKTRSWYAYGIGLVKESTYDKSGKLISTITLNEIKWN